MRTYTKLLYTWVVIRREKGVAYLRVNLFMTTNFLEYDGNKFAEMAERGDLSFVKVANVSRARTIILRSSGCGSTGCSANVTYGVLFAGNITLNRSFELMLNINTGTVSDENGENLGRFVPWINTARYPFHGYKEEFLMNWLNETVNWSVGFYDHRFKTDFTSIDQGYMAKIPADELKLLMNDLGPKLAGRYPALEGMPPFLANVYSLDGVLIGSRTSCYIDPVFYKAGILYISCWDDCRSMRGGSAGFELVKVFGPTSGSVEEVIPQRYFLLAFGLVAAAVLLLLVQRRMRA